MRIPKIKQDSLSQSRKEKQWQEQKIKPGIKLLLKRFLFIHKGLYVFDEQVINLAQCFS